MSKKKFSLKLAISSVLALTGLSAIADSSPEPFVVCPSLKAVFCYNNKQIPYPHIYHFYKAYTGIPPTTWTSNYYPGKCPDSTQESKDWPSTVSSISQGAEALCTYHSPGEKIEIFQVRYSIYCEKHFSCSPLATPTINGGCVLFNQKHYPCL